MGGRGSSGASGGKSEYRDIMSRLPDTPKILDFGAFPKLQGTEKQIQWANKIRDELVMDLANYAAYYTSDGRQSRLLQEIEEKGKQEIAKSIIRGADSVNQKVRQESINSDISNYVDAANRWNRVVQLVEDHTSATFWIDHRTNQVKNHMNKKLKAYIDGKK